MKEKNVALSDINFYNQEDIHISGLCAGLRVSSRHLYPAELGYIIKDYNRGIQIV
jgi:hypothetical protein